MNFRLFVESIDQSQWHHLIDQILESDLNQKIRSEVVGFRHPKPLIDTLNEFLTHTLDELNEKFRAFMGKVRVMPGVHVQDGDFKVLRGEVANLVGKNGMLRRIFNHALDSKTFARTLYYVSTVWMSNLPDFDHQIEQLFNQFYEMINNPEFRKALAELKAEFKAIYDLMEWIAESFMKNIPQMWDVDGLKKRSE